ncbi:Sphinganine C(4)-monooxygenase 1 [Hibiscus syriacus]|uniref:Sphinganine C(4)-monooxygenase 1 n=1 Tax=Hibiscus syriacus TaxID=106335 RepID=A0A6A2XPJ9_HIBSY|nr:Sphinganine C(4)-monooxygenase 1 [Hibiscus syriacus]
MDSIYLSDHRRGGYRRRRTRINKGTHELLSLVGDGEPSCFAQVWCWHGQWSFSSMGIGDMGTWDKASGGTSCCWEWSRESRCSARATREQQGEASHMKPSTFLVLAKQVIIAMVFIYTWAFFVHWYLHQNKFLYRHVHVPHHRLVVPYSFGAQYMHPIEGLFDIMGGTLAILLSGMSPRTSMFFISVAIVKLVDDHCGMKLPGNPFYLFNNNSAYYDIHHQLYGAKYNFSVYFVIWDKLLGTYMPYSLEKNPQGRLEVRRGDREQKHD